MNQNGSHSHCQRWITYTIAAQFVTFTRRGFSSTPQLEEVRSQSAVSVLVPSGCKAWYCFLSLMCEPNCAQRPLLPATNLNLRPQHPKLSSNSQNTISYRCKVGSEQLWGRISQRASFYVTFALTISNATRFRFVFNTEQLEQMFGGREDLSVLFQGNSLISTQGLFSPEDNHHILLHFTSEAYFSGYFSSFVCAKISWAQTQTTSIQILLWFTKNEMNNGMQYEPHSNDYELWETLAPKIISVTAT